MRRLTLLLSGFLVLWAAGLDAATPTLQVRYATTDRVYLDGGGRYGLEAGDLLQVQRDGVVIAKLEVVYVATHSASCRIVNAVTEVREGDSVLLDGGPIPTAVVAASPASESPVRTVSASADAGSTSRDSTGQQTASRAPAPQPSSYQRSAPTSRPLRTSVSGSLSFDWEQYTDSSVEGRDYDRSSARLSLRGRNLAGMPLELRVRTSTRTLDRVTSADGSSSISESRDRLYELSLAYEPVDGRFALRLGRLRLGRYAGVGTVDGISGEARLGRNFHLGLFGGSRSDISEFGYDGDRTTYGLTTRLTGGEAGRSREVLLAAVREDGADDVSREYVALQSRASGDRWSFYQRAELDLNNGWRQELAGSSSQLSTLFLNASVRASDRNRFSLSYSRFERYRTEETRFIPEALFDESGRQGVRIRWTIGPSRGLNVTLSGGVRQRDGDSEDATSAGLAVNHNNLFGWRLRAGLSVLTFANATSEGTTILLRTSKRLKGGHSISFTAGARTLDELLRGETYETQWARLGGWFELPGKLFGRAEVEASAGDELEGRRLLIGLGYRL